MNLNPNYPQFDQFGFKQEDFFNPEFLCLSQNQKIIQQKLWINNDINKAITVAPSELLSFLL